MANILIVSTVLFCVLKLAVPVKTHYGSPNNALEQIRYFGYPLEMHDVVTDDGYILQLHRIPHGAKNNSAEGQKPVVLFIAGMMCTAEVYTINGPSRSLPLLLADLGYDVWIGNTRGTTYSRRHLTLDSNVNNYQYWNFSNHEMGIYDIPTFIDFTLNYTKQSDLYYVGYSQGTTLYFIMISELPEYNKKIRLSIIMAPVTYTSENLFPVGRMFWAAIELNHALMKYVFHYYGMLTQSKMINSVVQPICQEPFIELCADFLFLLFGFDSEQLNRTLIPKIIEVFPAGTSVKALMHYWQNFKSGYFRQYDYGFIGNFLKYRQFTPPNYNVSRATAPVAIYCGKNDWLSSITEAERLANEISNLSRFYVVPWDKINHIDFLWATDVYELIYRDVIETIQRH